MAQWQLQEAKARLSEVVKAAQTDGPQEITVHGRPAVVVLSKDHYERLGRRKATFLEFMRGSPLVGVELNTERDKSLTRDVAV